ncbi:hypothetical protein ABOM_009648 [Aspergillus bombycis]|uniref:Zn(2)-C6 fungal-type domain-containing protein n=1 Tax=Aspergillus bombycis TaxID=109264 RepID=A0A1F7ZQX1_9EURO|nr:hypothetical protein ABOM_009648 [Aspergillus bombycis]OGM41832.1 hypothetical protein ABOM_009648 [Aspergillus bombycis]
MPGIPRSTGCQKCIQRRVKCDEARPACRECVRRNMTCPGYPQPFPFYNLHAWNSQESHRGNRGVRTYRPAGSDLESTVMDTRVMPNLATQSTRMQELDIFSRCVEGNFSTLRACYRPLVNLGWVEFALHSARPHPAFLQSAVRALAALHLGQTEYRLLIIQSLDMYNDALASMRRAVSCLPMSDEILAGGILLALYEMKNGLSQGSWISHTNSIAQIMQLPNVPAATYILGFSRTLFLTFRPFLIRASFSLGQPCFLERDEWISVVRAIIRSEHPHGHGSVFREAHENAFIEVVKVPGLAARTYSLYLTSEDMGLIDATIRCRNRLREIQSEIRTILGVLRGSKPDPGTMKRHLGSIPFQSAKNLVQGALDGIQSTLTLLENLLQHQLAHRLATQPCTGIAPSTGVVITPTYSTIEEFYIELMATYDVLPDVGWLDVCALSMGVVPARDVPVFPWQCQVVCGGKIDRMVMSGGNVQMEYN